MDTRTLDWRAPLPLEAGGTSCIVQRSRTAGHTEKAEDNGEKDHEWSQEDFPARIESEQ